MAKFLSFYFPKLYIRPYRDELYKDIVILFLLQRLQLLDYSGESGS